MIRKTVPESVQNIVDKYFNLQINGKKIPAPYFRNVKRVRAGLRVLVGKGTPEEIEEETLIYAKLRKKEINDLTAQEIREFMLEEGIGIDCSGFVSHLVDIWLRSKGKGGIGKNINYPTNSIYRKILTLLRPIESTGADILTNQTNSINIKLKNVLPGDLIRLKGIPKGDHVAMIYSVDYEQNKPISIRYVHSTDRFGDQSGVKFGEIEIVNPEGELKEQEWLETDKEGVKQTYQQLLHQEIDNGLRRLKCLKELQNA